MQEGKTDTVCLIGYCNCREDLDALLHAEEVPALPMYNQALNQSPDPARDTLRIRLSDI